MNDQNSHTQIPDRVTIDAIEAEIASEHYFTAAHGAGAAQYDGGFYPRHDEAAVLKHAEVPDSLRLLTFCVLVLRNGFTVTGQSACVSAANFDAELGRLIARNDAVSKVWPLLGFRLRDKLAAGG